MEWIYWATLIIVLIVSSIYASKREKIEQAKLDKFLKKYGYTFTEAIYGDHHRRLSKGFDLLLKDNSGEIVNLIWQDGKEIDLVIFDYVYYRSSGTDGGSSKYTYRAAYVELDDKTNPQFNLKPEKLLQKAKQLLFDDIDFEEHPTFSSSYSLEGEDEKAIRRLFNRNVMDFLVKNKGYCIESRRGCFLIYNADLYDYEKLRTDALHIKRHLFAS